MTQEQLKKLAGEIKDDAKRALIEANVAGGVYMAAEEAFGDLRDQPDLERIAKEIAADLTKAALEPDDEKRAALLSEVQGQLGLVFEIERIRVEDAAMTFFKKALKVVLGTAEALIVVLGRAAL